MNGIIQFMTTIVSCSFVYVCVCVCVHVRALSHVQVFVTPGRSPTRLLCPWNFPKQEYWIGLSFSLPGDLPDPRPAHVL